MNSSEKSDASEKVSKSEPCIDYHPNDRFCIQENKKTDNPESPDETMKDDEEVDDVDSANSMEEPEVNGSDEGSTAKEKEKVPLVNGSNEDSIESDACENDTNDSSEANREGDDEMDASLPSAGANHKGESASSEEDEKMDTSPVPEKDSVSKDSETLKIKEEEEEEDLSSSDDDDDDKSEAEDEKTDALEPGEIPRDVVLKQIKEKTSSIVVESLDKNSVDTSKAKNSDGRTENRSLSLIVDKLKNSAAAQGNDTQGDKSLALINKTLNAKGLQITKIKTEAKPPEPEYIAGPEKLGDDILEKAKFPAFLKGAIEIGNFISLPIPCSADFKLRDGEALLESPSLISPLLLKKPDKIVVEDVDNSKKPSWDAKPFFNSSAGEFLIGIGLSRAKEWFERDQVRLKKKLLKKDGKLVERETELIQTQVAYLRTKQANDPFTFNLKRCEFCEFKTESATVMEGHYLVPHLTARREYRCNFCSFTTRDHKAILFHMEALHGKKGILDLAGPFFYDCPFCMFETNLKTKATSHINKCQRYFLPARNQAPPGDWEHPSVTAKPITRADIKSYEMCVAAATASSTSTRGGRGRGFQKTIRPRGSYMVTPRPSVPLYQQLATSALKDNVNYRALSPQASGLRPRYTDMIAHLRSTKPEISVVSGGQIYQVVSNSGQVVPVINSAALNAPASQLLLSSANQGPQPVALFPNVAASNASRNSGTSQGMPRMASAIQNKQLPRLQGPYNTPTTRPSGGTNPAAANTSFVICEICDGYLKDLEQLRTHMLWIHKVKIHPKMLASRPPLNCQKCQWRFFTDQGLERHLLGAHGLVTSNMQELSNKNQDGGRCTICGRVYVCKLVSHMNQVHKIALKPAHLSYKCTVCTATFNLYKLFETHVYMFHSGSVKRPADNDSSSDPPKKKFQAATEQPVTKTRPGPASMTEKKKLAENEKKTEILAADEDDSSSSDSEVKVLDYEVCFYCGIKAKKLSTHMKVRHTRKCRVRLCRIEKCERCLCSFDGFVMLHTADFESDSEGEDPVEVIPVESAS